MKFFYTIDFKFYETKFDWLEVMHKVAIKKI